jgi:hypothetical protein
LEGSLARDTQAVSPSRDSASALLLKQILSKLFRKAIPFKRFVSMTSNHAISVEYIAMRDRSIIALADDLPILACIASLHVG